MLGICSTHIPVNSIFLLRVRSLIMLYAWLAAKLPITPITRLTIIASNCKPICCTSPSPKSVSELPHPSASTAGWAHKCMHVFVVFSRSNNSEGCGSDCGDLDPTVSPSAATAASGSFRRRRQLRTVSRLARRKLPALRCRSRAAPITRIPVTRIWTRRTAIPARR